MSRKLKDNIAKAAIYFSALFTVAVLVVIIGVIVIKGLPGINLDFLTRSYEDKTTYINTALNPEVKESSNGYIAALGITVKADADNGLVVTSIAANSPVKDALDTTGTSYNLKKGDGITKIGSYKVPSDLTEESLNSEVLPAINEALSSVGSTDLKVVRFGGGIIPMLVTTLYTIGLCLLIAGPIGIIAAIYLNEYAKPGKLMMIIHFAIENLAGIPSIIYGLFGSLFFVQICHMQYSILAGALTVSIILLPVIISTTEETLKAIPKTYRESSLGLGATKLQTISRIILPNAVPGILVAVLLSVGRIVGESAALLLTAGTVVKIPSALFGNSASGATLTIKAYVLMKEENDLTTACAIGIVLLLIIVVINILSKFVSKKFVKTK